MTRRHDDMVLKDVARDMAGRHYMNAMGYLTDGDVREAVFEVGAGMAFEQFYSMLEYHRAHGEWPGDTPNDDYARMVRLMRKTRDPDDSPMDRGVE